MQAIREIIKIDEEKCTGCGLCIPNCPEGALQIIDGKARLVSDLFCDGLGACIGHCPEGAITVEKREAQEYDERKVMGNVVPQGKNVIKAHLEHLKAHNQSEELKEAIDFLKENNIKVPLDEASIPGEHESPSASFGCPGSRTMDLSRTDAPTEEQARADPERERRKINNLRPYGGALLFRAGALCSIGDRRIGQGHPFRRRDHKHKR